MPQLELPSLVMIVCVALFTAIAAITDLRTCRIPNKLTVPVFVAGLLFQAIFYQWGGLLNALQAFALGFGTLFVLWLIGGGGGGDAKLMGALSVWIGWKMTLAVLIMSTVFVVFGTLTMIAVGAVRNGFSKTRQKYVDRPDANKLSAPEVVQRRQQRRVMTYALPVAVATWVVLVWFHVVQ